MKKRVNLVLVISIYASEDNVSLTPLSPLSSNESLSEGIQHTLPRTIFTPAVHNLLQQNGSSSQRSADPDNNNVHDENLFQYELVNGSASDALPTIINNSSITSVANDQPPAYSTFSATLADIFHQDTPPPYRLTESNRLVPTTFENPLYEDNIDVMPVISGSRLATCNVARSIQANVVRIMNIIYSGNTSKKQIKKKNRKLLIR